MRFLTGATGFVGSYLADRLLCENESLMVLARSSKGLSAEQRFTRALSLIARKSSEILDNLKVCVGDVTEAMFGLNDEEIRGIKQNGIDELWHCAGSISFSEKEEDKALTNLINVGGMENLLAFAEVTHAKKIFYIGTAYSDGNKSVRTFYGEKLEDFNNPYEESKHESERLLLEWSLKHPEVSVTIFKPSIVVGDTKYGKAFNYSGYFRFMQGFYRIRKKLEKKLNLSKNQYLELPITVLGNDMAEVNVISVDWAVDLMMAIRDSGDQGLFPIVNDRAPVYGDILATGLKALGIVGVEYQNGRDKDLILCPDGFLATEKMIQGGMIDYVPYVSWTYLWDLEPTIKSAGDKYVRHPVVDFDYLKIMLDYAVSNNFKLKV